MSRRDQPPTPTPQPPRCYHCGEPLDPRTMLQGFVGFFCPECWLMAVDAGIAPSTLTPFHPRD